MLGLLLPLALVAGLVKLAWREKEEPVIKPAVMRAKLSLLARVPRGKLRLDQAEDGVVLSRRLGERELEKRFTAEALRLKKLKTRRRIKP